VKISDNNLAAVLESLSPMERAAIEDCAKAARFASEEAVERLRSAVLRKVRRALKARARNRKEGKFRWLM